MELQGTSIFLVGMMGVGKSTVGQHLAQRLSYGFCDTDAVIEAVAGRAIAAFFAEQGEDSFRELEHQVLRQLSAHTRLVIACGGGSVLRPDNWGYLRDGLVVWLDLAPEAIVARLESDPRQLQKRPLLQVADRLQKISQLYNDRLRFYQQADVRVSAEGSPPAVVDRLLATVPPLLKSPCPPSPNNSGLN